MLRGGQGQHLLCYVCRSIKEFVKKIEQGNKPLDILVNNASIFITGDEVTEDGLEVCFFTVYSISNSLLLFVFHPGDPSSPLVG